MINLPSEVISPSENPNDFPILVGFNELKACFPQEPVRELSMELTVVTRPFCPSS